MHTYRQSKSEQLWTVGYYQPTNDSEGNPMHKWTALKDFNTEDGAAAYASYLNGGTKP